MSTIKQTIIDESTNKNKDCFYRYSQSQLGECLGPVDKKDRFGNSFCEFHFTSLNDIEEISELAKRQNITFNQAREVHAAKRRFERLRNKA